MGKCVRHIAREPAGHELIVLVLTHLRLSGHRFNSGSTNGPTPMQKISFSVYKSACPVLSRLGNCELSNEESNNGAVKSHASWCLVSNLRQKCTGICPLPAPPSTPKGCAHDQPARFQMDQAQREYGICASALPSPASTEW